MVPCLQLAGEHVEHIPEPLVLYNRHPQAVADLDGGRQRRAYERITSFPVLQPLVSLS